MVQNDLSSVIWPPYFRPLACVCLWPPAPHHHVVLFHAEPHLTTFDFGAGMPALVRLASCGEVQSMVASRSAGEGHPFSKGGGILYLPPSKVIVCYPVGRRQYGLRRVEVV